MLKHKRIAASIALGVITIAANPSFAESPEDNWPNWRGPLADGVAVKGDPPVTFSESENVKWKVPVGGESSSTPIVWGDKLFIQVASSPTGEKIGGRPSGPLDFKLVCFDRNTGAKLWEKIAITTEPHEGRHPTGSYAPYSPVTDGELLWAGFGSNGLYCYDLDGNLKWSRDLIKMQIRRQFGEGSSPGIAGDAVIMQMDHEGDSKIFAFNKTTGEPMWEKHRDEITSWTTPLGVEVDGKWQVITAATDKIRSYDAQTGDLIWEVDGLTVNAIPTPVTGFGNVYCTSGFRGYALKCIELGHTGDLTDTDAIKWQVDDGTPYVPSPLLYGERIYVTSDNRNVLSCYNAKTGEPHFVEEKLDGLRQLYASPVGAAGRVYIADRSGSIMVIEDADTLNVLAVNELDEGFDASPVIIGDNIYLNGTEHLYCISAS